MTWGTQTVPHVLTSVCLANWGRSRPLELPVEVNEVWKTPHLTVCSDLSFFSGHATEILRLALTCLGCMKRNLERCRLVSSWCVAVRAALLLSSWQEKRLEVNATRRKLCHKMLYFQFILLRAHSSFLKFTYTPLSLVLLRWYLSPNSKPPLWVPHFCLGIARVHMRSTS